MSKMINVPGTTDFIPLDDVINIKIKGRLVSKEELIVPDNPSESFEMELSTVVELAVVTTYVGDEDKDTEESEDKTASVTWHSIPLAPSYMRVELESATAFTSLTEKIQTQVKLRVDKYMEYLQYLSDRQDITYKIENTGTPIRESEEDSSEEENPLVEEEENIRESINRLTATNTISLDEEKLLEISAYLEDENNSEEKQNKRLEYLRKNCNKNKEEFTADDAYAFLIKLKDNGAINFTSYSEIQEAIGEVIQEVKNLIN